MDLWAPVTLATVSQARQRARELRRLTDGLLPRRLASTGAHEDWPLAGWAMLARACGTVDSVVALIGNRRATDAGVLTRSLFEQAVTFAFTRAPMLYGLMLLVAEPALGLAGVEAALDRIFRV